MSVEEQLARIRRHQQATLRDKKKGHSILGSSQDNTPSRSPSFTKENHLHSMQVLNDCPRHYVYINAALYGLCTSSIQCLGSWYVQYLWLHFGFMCSQSRRRDDVVSCDIQELEASLRQQEVVREQETPAEEIARLKEASHVDHFNVDREVW